MAAITHRTFLDLQTDVMARMKLPLEDESSPEALEACKGFINSRYDRIAFARNWPWRKADRSIRIYSKKTAGTLNITNGARSAVATSASFTALHKGWHIRIGSDEEIYQIIDLNVSSQTLYLSADYIGTTNTAATYTAFQFQQGLPPDCDEVSMIWSPKLRKPLTKVSPREFYEIAAANPQASSEPEIYTTYSRKAYKGPTLGNFILGYDFLNSDTDNDLMVCFFPLVPDQDYLENLNYLLKVTPLDADTDEPIIPVDKRHILATGAYADMLRRERLSDDANDMENLFNLALTKMANDDESTDDRPRLVVPRLWKRRRSLSPEMGDMGSYFDKYSPYRDF